MRKSDQLARFRSDGQSVSSERLVILLYDRLGRDLAEARAAMDAKEPQRRHKALLHAQQIVEELSYAVRPEVWDGGDRLIALYDFVLELLVQANVNDNRSAVDHAAKIIGGLAEAWRDAYLSLTPVETVPSVQ